jgi:hypothetical protein
MPQKPVPLTTYLIKENRPAYPIGSPGVLTVQNPGSAQHIVLCRIPIDQIPVGAVITSAILQFWTTAAKSGASPIRVRPINETWKSSVTFSNRPTLGSVITTTSITAPILGALYSFNVTAWANSRGRNGLALDTTITGTMSLAGSSAAINKPVLLVDYYTPNNQPVGLNPQGGAVSVPKPILSYTGDTDMDHQQIQYSTDGTVAGIVFDTLSIPAATGRYDPAAGAPALAAGASIYWRVQTTGGGGTSPWSPWVSYSYQPIVQPVITSPLAVTDDGSPTMTWDVGDQVSWQAELQQGSTVVSKSTWDVNELTRDWSPSKGVPLPNGNGLMVLRTTDSISPRVAAENAPVYAEVSQEFATVLTGTGQPITNLDVHFSEPFPVITGTRALGIPDEIALKRDGSVVNIWDNDNNPVHWAPGADFFTGTNFAIPDYTATPRQEHTWSVLTRHDGVTSRESGTIKDTFVTGSVWMVNPRSGKRIEILGNDDVPTVAQLTEEGSVLHTPVHGNLVVEPVRRRLMRTTRSGAIEGLVLNGDEDDLNSWALADSRLRYRLIFGKVNWPIIFGDYSPTDVFYTHPDPECDDLLVLINLNWWERLDD